MTYIPNPDKPCEADAINHHINLLYQCKKSGVWDMEGVMRWLKVNLDQVADNAEMMAQYIDEQFPGTEMKLVIEKEEAA